MTPIERTYDLATVRALWRRDVTRFWREPMRLASALGRPFIFWLVIGAGMTSAFRIEGVSIGCLEYFYPGVVMMVALFAAIFANVTVIEDRHHGFLQAVLAGPGSRAALVLGKSLGAASVAFVQVVAFLLFAPLAGFSLFDVSWPLLLGTTVVVCLGLSAVGFAMAWWLDSVSAYHTVQMMLLLPMWVLSGAVFPPSADSPVFRWVMHANPMASLFKDIPGPLVPVVPKEPANAAPIDEQMAAISSSA